MGLEERNLGAGPCLSGDSVSILRAGSWGMKVTKTQSLDNSQGPETVAQPAELSREMKVRRRPTSPVHLCLPDKGHKRWGPLILST